LAKRQCNESTEILRIHRKEEEGKEAKERKKVETSLLGHFAMLIN
jgi:hypothetical protein